MTMLAFAMTAAVVLLSAPAGGDTFWDGEIQLGRAADHPFGVEPIRDGTGRIWAAGIVGLPEPGLCTWENGEWRACQWKNGLVLAPSRPLSPGPDGSVLCFWQGSEYCVQLRGLNFRTVSIAQRSSPPWRFYVDSEGAAWMANVDASSLFHDANKSAVARLELDLGRALMLRGHSTSQPDITPATRDALGRFWLSLELMSAITVGAPILVFDPQFTSDRVPSREGFPGFPAVPVAVSDNEKVVYKDSRRAMASVYALVPSTVRIYPCGERHIWLALARRGLYELDVTTLAAHQVSGGAHGGPVTVEGMFCVNSGLGGQYKDTEDGRDEKGTSAENATWYVHDGGTLWRLRDGRWSERAQATFQVVPDDAPLRAPPFAIADTGVFVAAANPPLLFVPHDDSAVIEIDWRSAFPIAQVEHLFALPDGRFMAHGDSYQSVVFENDEFLTPRPALPQGVKVVTGAGLARDSDGYCYSMRGGKPLRLGIWDGTDWCTAAPPDWPQRKRLPYHLLVDDTDRVWLVNPDELDSRCLLYTRNGDIWSEFPSVYAAVDAQAAPVRWVSGLNAELITGPEGRIAILCRSILHARDAGRWRRWELYRYSTLFREPSSAKPFFSDSGSLCLYASGTVVELAPDGEWRKNDSVTPPKQLATRETKVPLASECGVESPRHTVVDDYGAVWGESRGALCRSLFGKCVTVIPPGVPSPFLAGRSLSAVLWDRAGGVFLQGYSVNGGGLVYISPESPLPETSILSHRVEGPFAEVVVGDPALSYAWRRAGGDWAEPGHGAQPQTLKIGPLAPGEYRIQLYAFDGRLLPDPTPASLTVRVEDVEDTINELIATVFGGDTAARQEAARALADLGIQFPTKMLPLLRDACATAPEDAKWWIEAVMEKIEDHGAPQ